MKPIQTRHVAIGAVSALALLIAGPTIAASESAQGSQSNQTIDIARWDNSAIYDGLSARNLLDEDAMGPGGEEIGEVEDFIIGKDGMVKAVVIEGGGFLDIGDTHVRVQWDKVSDVTSEGLTVPLTDDAMDSGDLANIDDLPPDAGNFRVRELIGDTVQTSDFGMYGYIRDVIMTKEGKVQAVLVQADYNTYGVGGWRAMPYSAGYYDPSAPYYTTPYTVQDLDSLEAIDRDRLNQ